MRLVLDTNVVASGLLWNGAPALLLDAAQTGELELFNLETSVERAGVYDFSGAGQGATTRNDRSIPRSCNAAMRPKNRAIQPVALSPNG